MELSSIINQYYDTFMIKYAGTVLPGHLKAMNAICSCRTPDSGELYVQCALTVITDNGIRYPVGTGVAQSARTMRPASGLIGNRPNYYLFPILWLLSHYLMN